MNPIVIKFGVHDYHRYLTFTGHFFGATVMICNAQHYESWPPPVQDAVEEAARRATALQLELAAAEDAQILAKLDTRSLSDLNPTSSLGKTAPEKMRKCHQIPVESSFPRTDHGDIAVELNTIPEKSGGFAFSSLWDPQVGQAASRNEVIHLTDAERAAFVDAVRPVLLKYRKGLDPQLFAWLEPPS